MDLNTRYTCACIGTGNESHVMQHLSCLLFIYKYMKRYILQAKVHRLVFDFSDAFKVVISHN